MRGALDSEQFGMLTDVGRVRDHNEDNCGAFPELGLYIVADGMGGHAAGEVASAIAVEQIPALVQAGHSLVSAVEATHASILDAAESGQGRQGMGCTVVAMRFEGNFYEIAWVGDSRGYLWNGSELRPLTKDHSFVQELIDRGNISEEEALVHPQRNVITQALGAGTRQGLKVGRVAGQLQPDEVVLLCSDGLTGEVHDKEIAQILDQEQGLPQAADVLIRAANDNGGSDNITVILVPFQPLAAHQRERQYDTAPMDVVMVNSGSSDRKKPVAVIIMMVMLVCGLIAWWLMGADNKLQTSAGRGGAVLTTASDTQEVVKDRVASEDTSQVLRNSRADESVDAKAPVPGKIEEITPQVGE